MKKLFVPIAAVLLLSACSTQGGGDTWTPAWKKTQEEIAEKKARPVYANQDRNGACWKTADCMAGLTCQEATEDVAGTCQRTCVEDADCGNGFLCRSSECQKDCAEIGEKCSERRVCCFFDQNGDRTNDGACKADQNGDQRCAVQAGTNLSANAEAAVEVPLE